MLSAIFLIGVPFHGALERVHPVAVPLGLLIGAGVGIPRATSHSRRRFRTRCLFPTILWRWSIRLAFGLMAIGGDNEIHTASLDDLPDHGRSRGLGARLITGAKMRPSLGDWGSCSDRVLTVEGWPSSAVRTPLHHRLLRRQVRSTRYAQAIGAEDEAQSKPPLIFLQSSVSAFF